MGVLVYIVYSLQEIRGGFLGRIPASELRGSSTWTFRLIGEHRNGEQRAARFELDIE